MAESHRTTLGPQTIDIRGVTYNQLTVVEYAHGGKNGKRSHWLCRCSCGNIKVLLGSHIKSGHTKSCGCHHKAFVAALSIRRGAELATHNKTNTPEFRTWSSMLSRCYNEHATGFANYGGRGIYVCDQWRNSFEQFLSDMGARSMANHSLERVDCNGHYEPGNCIWATPQQQNRNRRNNVNLSFGGETMCIAAWAERLGLLKCTIQARLKRGWSVDKTLSTPLGPTSYTHKKARS